jgi:hypothetical protein
MGFLKSIKGLLWKEPILNPTKEEKKEAKEQDLNLASEKIYRSNNCECGCNEVIGYNKFTKQQGHYFIKKHWKEKVRNL